MGRSTRRSTKSHRVIRSSLGWSRASATSSTGGATRTALRRPRPAEMYVMFQLRRLDICPVDDLGVWQGYGLSKWLLRAFPDAVAEAFDLA
jgi:hypothetical protein